VATSGHDIHGYGQRGGYVMFDNERYDLHARVHTILGYSARADQNDLLKFVK